MDRDDPQWIKLLPLAALAYNTRVHSSTGISPHEAFLGRPARLPLDLILQTPSQKYDIADAYIVETLDRFSQMFKFMRRGQETSFA